MDIIFGGHNGRVSIASLASSAVDDLMSQMVDANVNRTKPMDRLVPSTRRRDLLLQRPGSCRSINVVDAVIPSCPGTGTLLQDCRGTEVL